MTSSLQTKLALRDRFLAVLLDAGKRRSERENVVKGPYGLPEMEWAQYERQVMTDAVAVARAGLGLPPLNVADAVTRADQYASGHVDWAESFALYCAEITLGERWLR